MKIDGGTRKKGIKIQKKWKRIENFRRGTRGNYRESRETTRASDEERRSKKATKIDLGIGGLDPLL